jgi:hypothetical protein
MRELPESKSVNMLVKNVGFQLDKPFAAKVRPTGFLSSEKLTSLEKRDMYFMNLDTLNRHVVSIAYTWLL